MVPLKGRQLGREAHASMPLLPPGTCAVKPAGIGGQTPNSYFRPELRQDYPLNLSISILLCVRGGRKRAV